MYAINMGVHPNIEVSEGQTVFKGDWKTVNQLYVDHFDEKPDGGGFTWVIVRSMHEFPGRMLRRWPKDRGHEIFR